MYHCRCNFRLFLYAGLFQANARISSHRFLGRPLCQRGNQPRFEPKVFRYIRILGFKVVYLSIAIFTGSVVGGFLSGLALGLPLLLPSCLPAGMSYYSITGAYMTQVYGIARSRYLWVYRQCYERIFTVLLLPFLIKISNGSPIASGAAGNMDTMLVPVTKFVGG